MPGGGVALAGRIDAVACATLGANPMTKPTSRRTIAAAVIGNAFEFYEFLVYATFAPIIGRAFFPSASPSTSLLLSVATFGFGFVARPLGSLVLSAFADRHGRKPAMTVTIALMALGTGSIGLMPTVSQIGYAAPVLLVAARLIQGFSAGGEMGSATSFLIESAPQNRVAFYGSWQLSSQNMGYLAASLSGAIMAWTMPESALNEWGWRIPFLFGALVGPVGLVIRSGVRETLAPEAAHGSMAGVVAELFGRNLPTLALATLVIAGGAVSQYFLGYTTTYALTVLGFSSAVSMQSGVVVGGTGAVFALAGGLLADRIGVKAVATGARVVLTLLLYPALLLVLAYPSPALFIAAMSVLAAFQAISGAAGIVLLPLAFPARIRTAGLSIGYSAGVAIFGGSAQAVFTWLIAASGPPVAPIWYVATTSLVSVAATVALRTQMPSRPD